jgi:alpha-glucosidase
MTSDEACTARVPLGFLPEGRYRATVWEDGDAPDEVRRSERIVSARDTLALRLSPAGRAAVVLEPSSVDPNQTA